MNKFNNSNNRLLKPPSNIKFGNLKTCNLTHIKDKHDHNKQCEKIEQKVEIQKQTFDIVLDEYKDNYVEVKQEPITTTLTMPEIYQKQEEIPTKDDLIKQKSSNVKFQDAVRLVVLRKRYGW